MGDDNFFLFGLTEVEVQALEGNYNPQSYLDTDEDLRRVMNLLECGHFNQFEPGIFDDVINSVKSGNDQWKTFADFRSFIDAQRQVEIAYQDQDRWTKMSILNCASSGKFSTDRTITDYNNDIWKLTPVQIDNKF